MPSASEGRRLLIALEQQLSQAERKLRRSAFAKADNFIHVAQQAGGVSAFVAKTFTVVGDTQQRRVDLEVITGRAFHP